ncbi:hypothetical protein TELCIR_11458 [Teladorsagia circumcincta]|uniref:Reverse transcriptase domain-containing protein n=1 Tax=Teladorsagia circumcincta TaxID=45464 RepID=A0A2G9UAP0_TELCI|nr:hypothetical protein TELCIR_11458 [Teladorsagia circumcincta]
MLPLWRTMLAKECDFLEKRCHACNREGRKKGFCRLLTINTIAVPIASRSPFGVKAVPAIFRQQMDAVTAGLDGTAAYLDDITVTGKTIDEHNAPLGAVFERIQVLGLDFASSRKPFAIGH